MLISNTADDADSSNMLLTQVLVERQLKVFALSELPMAPVLGAHVVQGSITDSQACQKLFSLMGGELVDHVLSDISPAR